MSCLPNITHFAVILPQIYPFLLRACLVETNLNCLQHYILFLAQNYPHEKLYESVIGISRLIVDRFDIIKKTLSPPNKQCEMKGSQGSYSVILLGSLFELFRNAMEAAIHSQTMPQLSSSADFMLVTIPIMSQKAILHTSFIQAVFLLLSQNPPHGSASGDFTYLLDLWIPIQPLNRPEACAIEGKEKFSLPPSEILQSTLMSTNTRVLEASMLVAKPSLLCKIVEQFGCPIVSIEKVLEVLDDLCNESSAASELRHAVLDPASMATSVKIQMSRGTESGSNFLSFIRGLVNSDSDINQNFDAGPEMDCGVGVNSSFNGSRLATRFSEPLTERSQGHLQTLSFQDAEQQLLLIFLPPCDLELQGLKKRKNIMSVMESSLRELITSKQSPCGQKEINLIAALSQLLSGSSVSGIKFFEGMIKNRFSLSLLRMITKLQEQGQLGDQLAHVFKSTLHDIFVLLESCVLKENRLKSFVTVLKGCCKTMGVDFTVEEDAKKQIFSTVCVDLVNKNTSEVEAVVLDKIQRSSFGYLENVVSSLVRESVNLNLETECINMLHTISITTANHCVPIAFQYNPQFFFSDSASFSTEELTALPCFPDASGLLVDLYEMLDPETVHFSLEIAMKWLFGHTESFKALSLSLKSSSATNLLLAGQGYLLARLVNSSSWSSLLGAIRQVLDKSSVQDWYVFVVGIVHG